MRAQLDIIKKRLNLDLPPRKLAIRFKLPSTRSGAEKPGLLSMLALGHGDDLKDAITYLRGLQKQARLLNQRNFSVKARLLYTRTLLELFYPVALKLVSRYSKEGGIPDPENRQEALDAIIDIAARAIDSYKLVFKTLYEASRVRLALAGKDFTLSAFRILELTKFKQKVKGLRYQPLSDSAWLTVNNTFLAMLALDQHEQPMPLLENAFTNKNGSQSMAGLYIALQIAARLDILKWPTEWQSFLETYSNASEPGVRVKADDGTPPSRHVTLSYAFDNRPARAARVAEAKLGPSVCLDWEALNHVIAKDTQMFTVGKSQYEKVNISRKFDTLTYTEAMAIVKLQMEIFRGEPRPTSDSGDGGQEVDMRLYIGFWSVYDLLDNNFYPLHKEAVGTRLEDSLAKRSATLAEDHVSTHASLWAVQSRGEQEVTLRTQETQFTTAMRIGSLIAFGVGEEGVKQPGIGVISRIFRPASKTVVVDVEKFGNLAEPVLVTPDLRNTEKVDRKDKNTLHAILVRYASGKAGLLLPPDTGLGEKSTLLMKMDKQILRVGLGKIEGVTKDFSLFPLVRG